jgi:hypothetical protein
VKGRARRVVAGCLVVLTLAADLTALGLAALGSPLRPPVGAAGVGEGPLPVVLVAGFMSSGAGFARLIGALEAAGTPVLDFDPARPGAQPFTLAPTSADQHVTDIAATGLQPAIKAALARSGFDPERQHVDVVAHSVGGLVARVLVELPGGPVDAGWAARVDDLVMVATPNHGSAFGSWLARAGPSSPWHGIAGDFKPGSPLLERLGTAEPAGEVYTAIGGEAWPFNWLRSDDDGDGVRHGHDGVVPAESPAMRGALLAVEPRSHGRLLSYGPVVDRIVATLRAHA